MVERMSETTHGVAVVRSEKKGAASEDEEKEGKRTLRL